ncbi:hypothetical protein [Halostreptopolyspora alba]|uniref:Uncharacterized protein n=1 Tax=Halostreptopolyspora alba TaxID=2487137 RepID=A0A3N0E6U9_9ACTN|nr:hypothetical protein EFW17_15025 [Nocardiopsaceae bacterium YIM 96095]
MVRHNRRPVIPASELRPNQLSLYPGEPTMVACPDCGAWRVLRRSMVAPHRAADGNTRCPGSAQRIRLDLTPGAWLARLRIAETQAGLRRPTTVRPADPHIERVPGRVDAANAAA